MIKRLTSFILVLALSFSLFSVSAFAVEDINYYSLPPVGGSDPSTANLYPVTPFVTGDGWSNSDRNLLQAINNALTDISSGSIKWYLTWIYDSLRGGNIPGDLAKIQQNTLAIASRILDSNSLLGSINMALSGISGFATESTLSSYSDYFKRYFNTALSSDYNQTGVCIFPTFIGGKLEYQTLPQWLYTLTYWFGYNGNASGQPTLYRCIRLLQETLASEDDRNLAENNKENRDEVEKDFLGGQSGPTSLGKGDFSNASQVGGALNDTFNMGGASKVSDFVSGFGSAGEESLSWFSDTTSKNLDGLSAAGKSSSGVSTFSDDGDTMFDVDPDPYNMADFSDRYDWLEGVLG